MADRRVGHEGGDARDAALGEVRVAVRLEVVLLADAGVGHHRRARAGLDRAGGRPVAAGAVRLGAVEGVRAAELVTHLVGDVVDGEEVALGRGQAGAAAGLAVAADTGAGHAAARVAEGEVADVVAGGADELAHDDAVAGQRRARARGQVGLREARSRAARPVGLDGLGGGVEVELRGVVDQHQLDGQVVAVDVVDPVHQRDLLGQHIRGAEVRRVRRVGDQRQAVGAQRDLRARAPRRRRGLRARTGTRRARARPAPAAAPAARCRGSSGRGCRHRCTPGRRTRPPARRTRAPTRGSPTGSGRGGSWRSGHRSRDRRRCAGRGCGPRAPTPSPATPRRRTRRARRSARAPR